MAHAGGRPTKYDKSLLKLVDQYLQENQDEYDEYHKTRGEKSDTYERLIKVKLPTIVGFSLYIDVNESTLYEWAKEHEEFSKSLNKIKAEQQSRLINSGLSGDYNPVIAKLILSANHGMAEKTDVTSDGKQLPQPIISLDALLRDNKPTEDSEPS